MSHIVTIATEIRDHAALRLACERLQLRPPVEGKFTLFTSEATGWGFELPGWNYPVVCDVASGRIYYDNYQGRWGNPAELDRYLQMYAAEKVKLEARRQGHSVREQQLADGSLKLTIEVTGDAP